MNLNKEVMEKLARVRFVVTDFDGVHTDGCVYFAQDGYEMVKCSRKDGLGIAMLKKAGMWICVISREKNPVVTARCEKLEIPVYQGVERSEEKLKILKRLAAEKGFSPEQALYVGDDINDIPCLAWAGVGVTVADGHPLVKKVALITTRARGGQHAIRELCELILAAKNRPLLV